MSMLIVMEGLDGSGKSTQSALLEEYFKDKNIDCRRIKLPDYDSPSSTLVKMYLGGEFGKSADSVNAYAAGAFYAVDRFASFRLGWQKDYDSGRVILADRYTTSNFIYQMEKIDREKWDEYLDWSADFEYNKIGIPKPDLVIYFDMPIDVSQRLMTSRYNGDEGKKDVHEADVDFLNKCRTAALYTARKQGWAVVPCSDGVNPLPIDEIHKTVTDMVKNKLRGYKNA